METTDWTFPALDHVWEYRNGAILAGGDRLDGLCGDDRDRCLAALTQRVEMLVDRLDDGWLLATSFFMVEDLFKSVFRWDQWTPGMHDYIAATATVVIQELARRGFVLHYVIDNTEGDANLAAMLTYLPQVFGAAGLAVIGPQLVAVDLLMKRVITAINDEDYSLALALLNRIVEIRPGYAEGWNKRATLYYLIDDYGRSMRDIQMVLSLEPRHFGALSGLGLILQEVGQKAGALAAFRQALSVHPFLGNLQENVEELAHEVEGDAI